MNPDSCESETTRRELLARMGTGLVAITISSTWGLLSPAQARANGVSLKRLSESEGQTLEALGEVLLPGAASAGIAHYVDDQLASETPLLLLKYVDYPGPFLDFYQQGLGSLNALGRSRYGHAFPELSGEQRINLVREISGKNPPGWAGPSAPLFYFVTRSDAVDVFYGTEEGFARIEVPYMAHIR